MGGANIFQKSYVNQPNQGHQPWQSNSLSSALCHAMLPAVDPPSFAPTLQKGLGTTSQQYQAEAFKQLFLTCLYGDAP